MDRTRGYTLLELMMVVVLIGISVAVALPTMSAAVAEDKQHEAAMQILSVFRTARDTARRLGTPTLVLAAAPGGQFWIIPAQRQVGTSSSCSSVDWVTRAGAFPVPALNIALGTGAWGQDFDFDRYGITVGFNVAGPAVCYSSLGRVYLSSTGLIGPFSDAQDAVPAAGGALVVTVSKTGGNPRRVIIPMGSGMPRFGI